MESSSTHVKSIIVYFCLIFTGTTLVNDLFTALHFEGFYMSNRSKYIMGLLLAIVLYAFWDKKSPKKEG